MSKIEAANLTFVLSAVALLFAVYAIGKAREMLRDAQEQRRQCEEALVEANAACDEAAEHHRQINRIKREIWENAQEQKLM